MLVYHGQTRYQMASDLDARDVVLTTYDTLRSDWTTGGPLYETIWCRLILDEGTKLHLHYGDLLRFRRATPLMN